MALKVGIKLPKRKQLFPGERAGFGPGRVEKRGGMTFGQHEHVVGIGARIVRIETHHREEQNRDDIRRGRAAGGVSAARFRSCEN